MIKDSGDRTEYSTGAVRDHKVGVGRCDLMPLDMVAEYLTLDGDENPVLMSIYRFEQTGDYKRLFQALDAFNEQHWKNNKTMLLEVSKHFEEGAAKYGENNWQKGIPESSYIDSAVRHYLKWLRGDDDEQHDRAFIWNIMCLIWTHEHITNKQGLTEMAIRCVETGCYFNDDCFCTSHSELCNPARGKECAGYSAD